MEANINLECDDVLKIRMANENPDKVIECALPEGLSTPSGSLFRVVSCKAPSLSEQKRFAVFTLLESNMAKIYESVWGWDRDSKWKEMFSDLSFYLLVTDDTFDDSCDLVAFVHFQFTWDDEDEPEYPVLFCYEIQVDTKYQRLGIGKALIDMLLTISRKWKMRKVLLCSFKRNTDAMNFYRRIGFSIDENSPSKWGHDVPYELLSKSTN